MAEDMQLRNLAPATIDSYTYHVDKFCHFFGESAEELGPEEIRQYQLLVPCAATGSKRAVEDIALPHADPERSHVRVPAMRLALWRVQLVHGPELSAVRRGSASRLVGENSRAPAAGRQLLSSHLHAPGRVFATDPGESAGALRLAVS